MVLKFIGRLYKKIKDNQKGFTLVELMIVVVIIGIIAAVVLPRFIGNHREQANAAADSANLKLLQSSVERYKAENNNYPATLDELAPNYVDVVPHRSSGSTFTYTYATGVVK